MWAATGHGHGRSGWRPGLRHKKMEKRKKKKRKGEKTGPGHGQRVLHHKNLALLHNLLDECKDGKWMNNVREDILLVLVFLHRTFLVKK